MQVYRLKTPDLTKKTDLTICNPNVGCIAAVIDINHVAKHSVILMDDTLDMVAGAWILTRALH